MNDVLLVYVPLAIIITSLLGFLYMNRKNSLSRKNRGKDANYAQNEADSQVEYGRLINLFEMLSKFPLTSKGTNQLQDLMASIGVYTLVEQRVETARLLITSYVMLLTSVTLVYFLTDDLIFRVSAIIIAVVFRRDFINKRLRKERLAVWEDSYRSMSSLKNEYERIYSVPKAFNKATVEERSRLIFSSVQALFKADNPTAALAFFNQNNQNQIFQRFANLCYNSFYFGVSKSPATGIDTFTSNLDVIMYDLQADIDIAKEEKKKFYFAEKLPLIALLIAAFAPGFLTSRYPGMTYFYSGAFGYMAIILSLLLITLGYFLATTLNDSDTPIDDTFDFEVKLFLRPKFKDFWERRVPKFNKPAEDLLNKSLSYLTPAQFKFRQMYTTISVGLFVFLLTIIYVVAVQKSSVVDLGQLPAETMETIQENYTSPDEFAEKLVLDRTITNRNEMIEALKGENLNANEVTLGITADLLLKNRETHDAAVYTPMYLFIVFGAMLVAYQIPSWLLQRRVKLVNVEVQYEILILYALIVQTMHTPLKLRDYLKQFVYISKLYPKTHLDSYINQFNNPQFIKQKAMLMTNPQYYDLMEKLYTIRSDKTPLEVFREVEYKRQYLANQIFKLREEKLKNNYKILSIIVWVVMIAVITLQVIIPLAQFSMTAINQYSDLM